MPRPITECCSDLHLALFRLNCSRHQQLPLYDKLQVARILSMSTPSATVGQSSVTEGTTPRAARRPNDDPPTGESSKINCQRCRLQKVCPWNGPKYLLLTLLCSSNAHATYHRVQGAFESAPGVDTQLLIGEGQLILDNTAVHVERLLAKAL